VPFHPDALQNQVRHNVLTIMSGQAETIRQPDIDWEIKVASRPYEGLQELANEFRLGEPLKQHRSSRAGVQAALLRRIPGPNMAN